MVNPLWISMVSTAAQKLTKTCPHCGKRGVYPKKAAGQFYTCKHCQHRFKEKDSASK